MRLSPLSLTLKWEFRIGQLKQTLLKIGSEFRPFLTFWWESDGYFERNLSTFLSLHKFWQPNTVGCKVKIHFVMLTVWDSGGKVFEIFPHFNQSWMGEIFLFLTALTVYSLMWWRVYSAGCRWQDAASKQ